MAKRASSSDYPTCLEEVPAQEVVEKELSSPEGVE